MFGVGNKKLNNCIKKEVGVWGRGQVLKIWLPLLTEHILLSVDIEVGLWNYGNVSHLYEENGEPYPKFR
jgi:hypothetical protein